jgi:hypothetical protein
LKGDLIRDAAERHFPRLVAVQEFSNNLNQFISELVVFARESADSIAAKTKLKRSQQYMPGEECADSDSFVASCVRALVCGEKPSFDANNPRLLGKFTISDRFAGGGTLACGPRDSLLPWSEESVVFVIEQWERSGLGARAQRLRDAARDLRQSVAALELTYALQGDCQYVGKSK